MMDWKTFLAAAVTLLGGLWTLDQIMFEQYVTKIRYNVTNVQMNINETRREYEFLDKKKNRTPYEEARLEVLKKELEKLRATRDRHLGLQ